MCTAPRRVSASDPARRLTPRLWVTSLSLSRSLYVYIYIHIYIHIHSYIYVYRAAPRVGCRACKATHVKLEGHLSLPPSLSIYTHTHTHTHTHIYIYLYI